MRIPTQLAPLACILALAQPLAASRQAFLLQPLVRVPTIPLVDDPTPLFDCPAVHRTRPFSGVGGPLPKAPVFHACRNAEELRDGHLGARYLHQIRFPGDFYPALPSSIQAKAMERGLDPGQVDILCVVQTLPWKAGAPIQLRPQGWIDPEAPAQGAPRAQQAVWAGIFEAPHQDSPIHFSGRGDQDFFQTGILVRPGKNNLITGSGFDLVVDGLDYHDSTAFWTLTQLGSRAVATLHILVNDGHQRLLADLSRNRPEISLGEWLEWLNTYAGTEGLEWVDRLNALFGPLAMGARRPAAAHGDGEDKADPGTLWRGPAGETLFFIPEDGILFRSQSVPCVPGKRVQAACAVSLPDLARGSVRIGLRFDGIGLDMPAESRNLPGMDQQSATAGRKVLECQAIAPPKASRVSLFVLAEGMVPGQKLELERPAFTLEGARPRANQAARAAEAANRRDTDGRGRYGSRVPPRFPADFEPAGGAALMGGAPWPSALASSSLSASSSSSASPSSWSFPVSSASAGAEWRPGMTSAPGYGPAAPPLWGPDMEILGPPGGEVPPAARLDLRSNWTDAWLGERVDSWWPHNRMPVEDPAASTPNLALDQVSAPDSGDYAFESKYGSREAAGGPVRVMARLREEARVETAGAAAGTRAPAGNLAAAGHPLGVVRPWASQDAASRRGTGARGQSGSAAQRLFPERSEPAGGAATVVVTASSRASASSSSSASTRPRPVPAASDFSGPAPAPGTAAAYVAGPAEAPPEAPRLDILGLPVRQVLLGTPLVLTAQRTGAWPDSRVTYQWYRDGWMVDDRTAKGSILAVPSAGLECSGDYLLEARAGGRVVFSMPVRVEVQVPD